MNQLPPMSAATQAEIEATVAMVRGYLDASVPTPYRYSLFVSLDLGAFALLGHQQDHLALPLGAPASSRLTTGLLSLLAAYSVEPGIIVMDGLGNAGPLAPDSLLARAFAGPVRAVATPPEVPPPTLGREMEAHRANLAAKVTARRPFWKTPNKATDPYAKPMAEPGAWTAESAILEIARLTGSGGYGPDFSLEQVVNSVRSLVEAPESAPDYRAEPLTDAERRIIEHTRAVPTGPVPTVPARWRGEQCPDCGAARPGEGACASCRELHRARIALATPLAEQLEQSMPEGHCYGLVLWADGEPQGGSVSTNDPRGALVALERTAETMRRYLGEDSSYIVLDQLGPDVHVVSEGYYFEQPDDDAPKD